MPDAELLSHSFCIPHSAEQGQHTPAERNNIKRHGTMEVRQDERQIEPISSTHRRVQQRPCACTPAACGAYSMLCPTTVHPEENSASITWQKPDARRAASLARSRPTAVVVRPTERAAA